MIEDFHIDGMVLVLRDILKMSVRYWSPSGPRCLRWRVEIPSGPKALEAFAFLIASCVFCNVMFSVLLSLFFLSSFVIVLFDLVLEC